MLSVAVVSISSCIRVLHESDALGDRLTASEFLRSVAGVELRLSVGDRDDFSGESADWVSSEWWDAHATLDDVDSVIC